jgi:hypothetical protein
MILFMAQDVPKLNGIEKVSKKSEKGGDEGSKSKSPKKGKGKAKKDDSQATLKPEADDEEQKEEP